MAAEKKLTFEQEQRVRRARIAKAHRFLHYFWNVMRESGIRDPEHDRAALTRALGQVEAATPEQWAQIAQDLRERSVPSADSIETIKAELRAMIARLDRPPDLDDPGELFGELMRQRSDPTIDEAIRDGEAVMAARRKGGA